MDAIQEVGAYAGFAAVVGLAVLAALFFSQARDLRRLREWAGRAPERAAEQAAAQATLPPQPPPTGAVRPIPAAKPAQAAAARTGAGPAVAAAKPATAAATAGAAAATKPGEKKDEAAPGDETKEQAKPGEEKKDEAKPGEEKKEKPTPGAPAPAPAAKPAPATAAAAPAVPRPGAPVPPARPPAMPARPAPVGHTPAPTAAQSTAVLPASARVRDLDRPDRRGRGGLEGRYIALIVAGVVVVGGGIAFGVSQLGGEDDAPSTGESAKRDSEPAGPLNRSLVTVSVLNGTTVPGLAAQIGDEIESKGFQRGNVANAIDQQRQESAVLFAEGGERPARVVARVLGISAVEPVDPDSQALAGNASVVVVVGADQTQ